MNSIFWKTIAFILALWFLWYITNGPQRNNNKPYVYQDMYGNMKNVKDLPER